MDKNTLYVIIAVLLVGVAAVSIGYAYTAYTSNQNNSADVEYLIIVPSDGTEEVYSGTFSGNVTFDTQTVLTDKGVEAEPRYVTEVIYSLSDYDTIETHKYSALGQIYLTIDETKSVTDYKARVSVAGGTGLNTDEFKYYAFFQIGSDDTAAHAKTAAESALGSLVQLTASSGDMVALSDTIENDPDNDYTVVLLTIYVGLKTGDSYTKALNDPLDGEVLDTVTFTFAADTV